MSGLQKEAVKQTKTDYSQYEYGPVSVGDLSSSARGSGARKNAGKPDWSQFPIWTIAEVVEWLSVESAFERVDTELGLWQRGEDRALDRAAAAVVRLMQTHEIAKDTYEAFALVVKVLEFGEKKYAKGNWAKGMAWSVCFSCAASHYMKWISGREIDEESGVHTLAHLLCNILFLIAYRESYPEGDDRIPEFRDPGDREAAGFAAAVTDTPHRAKGDFETGEVTLAHARCNGCRRLIPAGYIGRIISP